MSTYLDYISKLNAKFTNQLRYVELEGQEYFSVVDLVAQATGRDYEKGRCLWTKFKVRARKSAVAAASPAQKHQLR